MLKPNFEEADGLGKRNALKEYRNFTCLLKYLIWVFSSKHSNSVFVKKCSVQRIEFESTALSINDLYNF